MQAGKREVMQTLRVLGRHRATRPDNGAVVVQGGIGAQNIVTEEAQADHFYSKGDSCFGTNIRVSDLIYADTMYNIDPETKSIVYKYNLEPGFKGDKRVTLGSSERRWERVYANFLDGTFVGAVEGNITDLDVTSLRVRETTGLGTNSAETAIFSTDPSFGDAAVLTGDLIAQAPGSSEPVIELDTSEKTLTVSGETASTFTTISEFLAFTPQTVIVDTEKQEIDVLSSLLYLDLRVFSYFTLKPPPSTQDGVYVKLVLRALIDRTEDQTVYPYLVLLVENIMVPFEQKYDQVELLFRKATGIYEFIGGTRSTAILPPDLRGWLE